MSKQFEWLQKNKYKLLDKYEGKWIVICDNFDVFCFNEGKEALSFLTNNRDGREWTMKKCTYEAITKVWQI